MRNKNLFCGYKPLNITIMKKHLLLSLSLLLSVASMLAQSSTGYIPLVVEGARWECEHLISPVFGKQYKVPYTIEITGDTIIDDITYNCCVYTFEETVTESNTVISPADTLSLAFIREDVANKKVYARLSESQQHDVYARTFYDNGAIDVSKEFLLYDFADINNPEQMWKKADYPNSPLATAGKITIDGTERNCYSINNGECGYIIEGIGYDGYGFTQNAGDLICQFPVFVSGTDHLPSFKAHKDVNGKTTYNAGDALNVYNSVEGVDINTIATEVARYDIYGRKLSQPTNGINIVKMSNGSTCKEYIK